MNILSRMKHFSVKWAAVIVPVLETFLSIPINSIQFNPIGVSIDLLYRVCIKSDRTE